MIAKAHEMNDAEGERERKRQRKALHYLVYLRDKGNALRNPLYLKQLYSLRNVTLAVSGLQRERRDWNRQREKDRERGSEKGMG